MIFKYKIIDERFPNLDNEYELTAYHSKEVLVEKSFLGITISKNWYYQHINSDFNYWIRTDTLDNWGKWKTLPNKLEESLNDKFIKEFDEYHKIRKSLKRDKKIKNIING